MTEPTPTAPTPELERETPHERLKRREEAQGMPAAVRGADVCRALLAAGTLRNEELARAVGFGGSPEEWKQLLWRLQNEGYVKVRWVGLADPDPVETRLTERGRAWAADV